MYFIDYHTHTKLSPDGSVPLADMADAAVAAGLNELCITDHCDLLELYGEPVDHYDWPPALEQYAAVAPRYAGKLTIRLGLEQMEGMDGCLFVMGDQPLCGRESMERLLDAFLAHPDHIVRLSWRGTGGSPTLFPSHYFPSLAALTGERGGMAAVRDLNPPIFLVEARREEELWDCDTPEDLERIRAFWDKRGQGIP